MARTAGSAAVRGTVTLEGAKELDAKLKGLPRKLQNKILRQALRAGAKVIHAEAKAQVPVETGALRKSIKVRAGKRRRKGEVAVNVVTSASDNLFSGDQYYGGFIEFGFHHGSRKLGDARKFIQPKPFLRPAFDSKKDAAVTAITQQIRDGLEQAAKESA